MELAYDSFNASPHIDPLAKIANAACAAIGAGAWMEVLPVEPALTMCKEVYDAAFYHRFLLSNDCLIHGGPTRCHCGLRPTDLATGDRPSLSTYGRATGPGTQAASCGATTLSCSRSGSCLWTRSTSSTRRPRTSACY